MYILICAQKLIYNLKAYYAGSNYKYYECDIKVVLVFQRFFIVCGGEHM